MLPLRRGDGPVMGEIVVELSLTRDGLEFLTCELSQQDAFTAELHGVLNEVDAIIADRG